MKVFLSHATEAKPRVREIAACFPAHVEVWLDQDELSTGVRLPEHIGRAINDECDFVLVFVDRHAVESEWVRREVGMALQRENDLRRTFLLPVLLEPLAAELPKLGDLGERVFFDATDATPEGVRRTGERIAGELFALASRLIETLRSSGRRQMLADFNRELTEFKQVAFMWLATLGNPLAMLSTNQEAFDRVREAVARYNEVADRFIPRLDLHRERLCTAWSHYRRLTQDIRDAMDLIENEVYRGALYRLNEIHEMIHALDLAHEAKAPDVAAREAALEPQKEALLAQAAAALERMSTRSTDLVAEIEREI